MAELNITELEELKEYLLSKIKILNETIWGYRVSNHSINRWLGNFSDFKTDIIANTKEQVHPLYLLRYFTYFGDRQIRELLKCVFRDLYKYPIVEEIRRNNNDTTNIDFINDLFKEERNKTRFLGMGNPAESGSHLLYYFRHENLLPKDLFINTHEIFQRYGDSDTKLKSEKITRYVFIDDVCASGQQAIDYSNDIIQDLKRLKADVQIAYYCLFGIKKGIERVIRESSFDIVKAIFEFDESFECFSATSRYFFSNNDHYKHIEKDFAHDLCLKYGKRIYSYYPLGFGDGQLLLGLHHNTPDNTLPIFWCDESSENSWVPIFKRYVKNDERI